MTIRNCLFLSESAFEAHPKKVHIADAVPDEFLRLKLARLDPYFGGRP